MINDCTFETVEHCQWKEKFEFTMKRYPRLSGTQQFMNQRLRCHPLFLPLLPTKSDEEPQYIYNTYTSGAGP